MKKAWKIELREASSNVLKEWFTGRLIPNSEVLARAGILIRISRID